MNIPRVGLGADSHPLVEDREGVVVLGGVRVARGRRMVADSDGDVVIHALCNALSTAVGGGSLDTWAGEMAQVGVRDSREFLRVITSKLRDEGFDVGNVAIMIEAAWPRLEKHREAIQNSLAKELKIGADKIGIACTSGEGLTAFGKGEGIYVMAQVLIVRRNE